MPQNSTQVETDLLLQEPKMSKVILLNDDYTTMEFVIKILMQIFGKTYNESTEIMLSVHRNGSAVCGVYPYDVAEFKTKQARMQAKKNGFPLRVIMQDLN
ncbi:ATP-dependent Clp protease adaptor ClpS [Helicobacter cappadocius]|uniref:ATP-dependent Clp protease adapter protein ClpS n=1 Tax=Helicobacter cappadocius TaxID=3063998 RepID=A0AA90PL65_9HELI|nr:MULTISPECIES: ATP-dependent Clp protease adaptor ClpS [unclassified Helicobacter]MDO7253230.1 ATP-dependent Clp protease adaptor ClpS [Helicobacter sp. faydin-H75]MDP2539154.1 ATP-dependent Clp protease adaptor ClpS [Helicobacter sp. faydin-H76]